MSRKNAIEPLPPKIFTITLYNGKVWMGGGEMVGEGDFRQSNVEPFLCNKATVFPTV